MTDQEKIAWFDETVKWMDQWSDPESAIDDSYDAAADLFFDFVEQYQKVRKK